jgi:hypothetical protein
MLENINITLVDPIRVTMRTIAEEVALLHVASTRASDASSNGLFRIL